MKIDFYTKKFKKTKYELLTEEEYNYIRDNYNKFIDLVKQENKQELLNVLNSNYSYSFLGKIFVYFFIYAIILYAFMQFFKVYEFFIWIFTLWFLGIIGSLVRISSNRSLTKDSFKTNLFDITDYYYYHRLMIEKTNTYEEYRIIVEKDSKGLFKKYLKI